MRHRTALITAGSIALVVFAGAVAAGANLGILNAADAGPFGTLSAAADVQTAQPEVVQVYARETPPAAPQQYVIKKAGTVSVAATKDSLHLTDVNAKPGWRWSLTQNSDKKLTVTFKSSSATYTFLASLDGDGTLVAKVEKPVTRIVTSAPSGSGTAATPAASATTPPAPTSDDHEDDDGESGDWGEEDD